MHASEKICKFLKRAFDLLVFGGFTAFLIFSGYQLSMFIKQYSPQLQKIYSLASKLL